MPERTVNQTLASYRRADGSMAYALQGEVIDVAADGLADFDKANGIITVEAPTKKTAPKKAARK